MASTGFLPSLRSASSAKSIIMMAFFFTMPISRMMPIKRHHAQVHAEQRERENCAHAGRGQRGQNRDGMDVALVQHAQHDVHGDDGRQNQPAFIGQRCLKGPRRALEASLDAGRQSDLGCGLLNRLHRLAQRSAVAQVEGDGDRRELSLVVDGQRPGGGFEVRDGAQRTCSRWRSERRLGVATGRFRLRRALSAAGGT